MRAHAHTCAPSTRDTRHVAATETSRRGYTNCPRATLHSKPHRARRYESQRHNATNSGQQSAQKVPRDEGAAPRRHRLHAAQAASSGGTVRSGEAAGMHHTGRTCQVLVRPTSAAVQAAGSRQVKKARTSPSAHCTAIETTKHGPYPHIRTHTRHHHTQTTTQADKTRPGYYCTMLVQTYRHQHQVSSPAYTAAAGNAAAAARAPELLPG